MSECTDENKNHNCDICRISLSICEDVNGDYICDYCLKPVPVTIVSVAPNCLVNGSEKAYRYEFNNEITLFFSYEGDNVVTVEGWVIKTADGDEIARIGCYEFYVIRERGEFYAEPIFSTN